jgi:RNA recognition motif-containing protein
MAKKLYIGNLSYDTTEDGLRTLFADVGPVESVSVITDRMTGRSRGFAFVEMATDEAAAEAISRLNGQMVDGREISVAEARPPRQRDDRPGGGRPRGGFGGGGGGRGPRGGGDRDRDRGRDRGPRGYDR